MSPSADPLLKAYRQKRDFAKTAEPAGKAARRKTAKALSFVVQKHDATRLHYDFRLELDGVLKSWAVTRGPSSDPADKRLAVRVEDHPLDYGGFEGTIPEGQYGGGTVMLWDEGTWEPIGNPHQGLNDGDLKFRLNGKRMKGEWVLVHMKGRDRSGKQQWLLIKHRDEFARSGDGQLTVEYTTSVETGRDLDGIAKGNKPRRKSTKVAADAEWQSDRAPVAKGGRSDKSAKAVVLDAPMPTKNVTAEVEPNRPAKAPAAAKASAKPSGKLATVDLSEADGVSAAERLGVHFTSPDRIEYPGPDITKGMLAAYYEAVAERMLPFISDHPLSLVRCPQGAAKACFFQKHDSGGFPAQMKKVAIAEKDGQIDDYFYVDDLAGLVAGVQMNVLEFHLWGSMSDNVERPNRIIFDIDPDEGLGFAQVTQAAVDIRGVLGALGLESFALLTGGKGVHVVAPLKPSLEWPEVKAFCHGVAQKLADAEPDRFVVNMAKAKRVGRMFIDYLRNERGSTAISPWSTRSRDGAPCAVPVSWEELPGLPAANMFTIGTAAARAGAPDPWKNYFSTKQAITPAMLKAVGAA